MVVGAGAVQQSAPRRVVCAAAACSETYGPYGHAALVINAEFDHRRCLGCRSCRADVVRSALCGNAIRDRRAAGASSRRSRPAPRWDVHACARTPAGVLFRDPVWAALERRWVPAAPEHPGDSHLADRHCDDDSCRGVATSRCLPHVPQPLRMRYDDRQLILRQSAGTRGRARLLRRPFLLLQRWLQVMPIERSAG